MTSREMRRGVLKPGHIWYDQAPLGESPDWVQVPKPADFDSAGDPNAQCYSPKLFGYDVDMFMAKQYR